jgi:hypothetical protein
MGMPKDCLHSFSKEQEYFTKGYRGEAYAW